jgi:hypothetical protein
MEIVVFFLHQLDTVYLLPKHDEKKRVRDVISEHEWTMGVR